MELTDRQARAVAFALAYGRLADDRWPDWEDYPWVTEVSWEMVLRAVEDLAGLILDAAHAMVDDPDELDELLRQAEFGANDD